MIRDFREKYNISETDLNSEISNQLADIDIQLDNNAKKYNLKTVNELLVQQKLLNNLKNKMDNNEEVYVRKEQQGGGEFDTKTTDSEFATQANGNLIILDLQSVLKYKPNGQSFVLTKALEQFKNEYATTDSILHVICDDNMSWTTVTEKIPTLKDWITNNRFHTVSGFLHIQNKVREILTNYQDWITNKIPNTKIVYISRNWNKSRQVNDLNKFPYLNLKNSTNDPNTYKDDNVSVEFMNKDKVPTTGNYIDQIHNVRSMRESMSNPQWISPFLINNDHFKSLMTRLSVDKNNNLQKY
jgi:hypothetical protein